MKVNGSTTDNMDTVWSTGWMARATRASATHSIFHHLRIDESFEIEKARAFGRHSPAILGVGV